MIKKILGSVFAERLAFPDRRKAENFATFLKKTTLNIAKIEYFW